MKSLTAFDGLFLLVAGSGLACGIWLFFNDPAFAARAGSGVPVGSVTFRERDAERRLSGSSLWASLSGGQDIYDGDTVRTGDSSKATISLGEASEITLDEQSMVIIRVSGSRTSLSVSSGSAALSSSVPVSLDSGNGSVVAATGSFRLTNTPSGPILSADDSGAIVSRGDGTTVALGERTRFDMAKGTASEAAAWVSEPVDGAIAYASPETARVKFSWSDPARAIRLESPGNTPLRLAAGGEPQAADDDGPRAEAWAGLPPGRWSWSLEGTDERGKLTVFPSPEPRALSPSQAELPGGSSLMPVTFRWSAGEGTSRFRFALSGEDGAPIADKTVIARSVTIPVNGSGAYRWSVTALAADGSPLSRPIEAVFTVLDSRAQPPVLEAGPSSVTKETLKNGTVLGRWNADPRALDYEVRVSADPDGAAEARTVKVSGNYYAPSSIPESGLRYIAVRARYADGYSAWSSPSSVAIKSALPPALEESDPERPLPVVNGSVTLSWSDETPLPRYRVSISPTPDFASVAAETVTRASPAAVRVPDGLSDGFWWRVEGLDARGNAVTVSKVSRAAVARKLSPPVPKSPADGTVFELNKTGSIRFSWSCPEQNVKYRLTVFRSLGGLNVPVGSWETGRRELTLSDLSILSLDTFSWNVEALPGNDGTRSSVSESGVFAIRQKEALAVPKIRKMETRGAL